MNKKNIIRWLCLLLIVTVAGAAAVFTAPKAEAAPAGLVLEDMPIVLPANATEVEKTAAKELQHYLREITGSASSMITESVPVDSAIYIGATEFAQLNNVTYTDKNGMGEGWAIKAVGQSLVITGGVERGTLYGVYHLLEDVLGVHWWNMWEEYVPELDSAVIPYDFDLSGEPLFADRGIYSNESLSTLYYVRNRHNGWTSNAPQAFGGEEEYTRPYNNHTFEQYYPPFYTAPKNATQAVWKDLMNPEGISYFEEHPEWYAWSDTRQARISYGQLCLSNKELLEDFTDKILKCIALSYEDADKAGVDRPSYVDITPNDTGGHCECDECEASIAASGRSGHLLKFINQIAAAVYEVYPEMTVETLAYHVYFDVPLDDTVPADNVVIRLASNDVSVFADMDDAINAKVKARLEAWGKLLKPGQLWYWDYGIAFGSIGVVPNMFKFGPDWQKLYEAGGTRVFQEVEDVNTLDFWDMKHWLWTKLMEDPYQDQYELAEIFANGYYGEDAAEEIMEWLLLIDQEVHEFNQTTQVRYSTKYIDNPWLSAASIKKGYQLFEKAIAETEANPDLNEEEKELFINRINFARLCLDAQILANYTKYVDEMSAAGELLDIGKRETGLRMIGALQWAMNMELEEDYTGVQNMVKRGELGGGALLNTYAQYMGEQHPNSGEFMERPAIPEQIYEDHPGINDRHIYDYTDTTFWDASYHFGFNFVGSYYGMASYEGGSAVMWDIRELARTEGKNDELTPFLKQYYTFSETKSVPGLPGMYLGDPVLNDGEYHLYRLKDQIVVKEGKGTFSVFASTMNFELKEMLHLLDVPVDVYVSMKVVGDPTGEDPNNYAKIYIDRVIFVEPCTAYDVNYTSVIPATCASNEIHVGICPICGQDAKKEIPGTKLSHTFTGDYIFDETTGMYRANCSVCGEVEYDHIKAELPDDVLAALKAEGTELDRVYDFTVQDFDNGGVSGINADGGIWWALLNDPDSNVGRAFFWDLNEMDGDNYSYFNMTNGIRTSGNKIPKPIKAADVMNDGQYHYYKMEDIDLFANNSSSLIFFDWTLQVDFTAYPQLQGKRVDMYLSLKVEGDMVYGGNVQMPKYYIDRIIIAENCPEHTTDDLVYEDGAYVGVCSKCGKEIVYDFGAPLPQEILDSLKTDATSLSHVYTYTVEDFRLDTPIFEEREDPDSPVGKAAVVDAWGPKSDPGNYIVYPNKTVPLRFWGSSGASFTAGDLTYDMLNGTEGTGYQVYKLDNVVIPDANFDFMHFLYWGIQCDKMAVDMAKLKGNTVDFYISMKIEGDLDNDSSSEPGLVFYVDQILMVSSCVNYMSEDNSEKLSDATCDKGEVWHGQCSFCGKILEVEMKETQLDHKFGEYEYDTVTGKYVSRCQNSGCDETRTLNAKGDLPQIIKDDLAANNTGLAHVYDYTVEDFRLSAPPFVEQADADSLVGKAAVADAWGYLTAAPIYDPSKLILKSYETFPVQIYSGTSAMSKFVIGDLTYDMLNGTEGMGYQVYKFEDITIPNANFQYLYFLDWGIQCDKLGKDLANLKGRTVDFYVSMKIEGDLDNDWSDQPGLVIYVDRIAMVDSCDENLEYKAPEGTTCADGTVTLTATCPVCGVQKTKEGPVGGHEFGEYYRVKGTDYEYRAECIYGCGTTDTKYDPRLTLEEKLPAELPASAREHVIVSYSCDEFILSGEELYGYRWDHDLNRPVGVREYDTTKSAELQYALDLSGGLNFDMYQPGKPTEHVGSFKGDEIMANAGDGKYHLYTMKGVVPIKGPAYQHMFMFNDWVLQCWMFNNDLRYYRGEALDIYLYMKVDGDPTCAGAEKPVYYIDQIIVAKSCTTDETWVVTKEATCSEMGEMTGTCTTCGLEGAVVGIPMLRHTFNNPLISKQATCTTNAFEFGHCAVCGMTYKEQEVPGTMLEHSFSNYVKQEDGVTEVAYCDNGCGERHIRNSVSYGENIQLPEPLQPIIPILGGAAGAPSFGFSDIKESDWYFESVKEAWSNKLINGVTATEFRPNETLTVAQAVKLASAYHEMNYTGDVTLENGSGNWYSSYVDYAVENGIIDSKYASYTPAKMNKAIDRSEFVSIFVKAMDEGSLVGYNDVADNAIPDVKTDDANAEAIYKFYRAGILTGSDGKGTFNPTSSIKRSEVAAILSRMYNENVRQAITLK